MAGAKWFRTDSTAAADACGCEQCCGVHESLHNGCQLFLACIRLDREVKAPHKQACPPSGPLYAHHTALPVYPYTRLTPTVPALAQSSRTAELLPQ